MDTESSSKFIGSLSKFLQSLCNGYVDFDDGVELIGHIYLSVDGGKTGRKLNYFLNEKVCKNDNSVTFISNSFHAQPESKGKGKEGDGRKDDEAGDASESVPKSTNVGTLPSRAQLSRSATSPNAHRAGNQAGSKRPGSPLSAPTPPSQRRMQSSTVKGSVGSPAKIVPSSPSSSSQDNVPSPSPARKNKSEISRPASNQSDNASADNESDIVPPNVMAINPPPDFASFLGSLTGDNQSSRDQRSPPDIKPETDNDTDVTFIKEEFVSEPSSCAQAGSGGQAGGSGDDLYPVMLHQNSSVFPSTSAGYPPSTATSQHPAFHGPSTSQSHLFQAGSSQDGTDPSGWLSVEAAHLPPTRRTQPTGRSFSARGSSITSARRTFTCRTCHKVFLHECNLFRHRRKCEGNYHLACQFCGKQFYRRDYYQEHLASKHNTVDVLKRSFRQQWS